MNFERLLSYPLALLGSLALINPASDGSTSMRGTAGAPANVTNRGPVDGAGAQPSFHMRPATGRQSAESAELRALRAAEGSLFPELGAATLDLRGAHSNKAICDAPDFEFARSTALDVSPAGDWLRGLQRPDIAVPRDPRVARYLRYFGADPKGRETFAKWLRRSGAYASVVTAALSKRNLPQDLIALMFVESGCLPKATSSAGAQGLWQFMPQTAEAYGLIVRPDFDERRNIWRATDAAVAHLADLYAQFESWHLAMAAYNLGYQQLLDRLKDTSTEDYFALSKIAEALPRETVLYVPKILAVAVILRNLTYFGFDGAEKAAPISASRLEVPPGTRLSLIARAAGTSLRKVQDLNPQFLGQNTPDTGAPNYIYLPTSGATRAKTMLPRLLEESSSRTIDLRVTADFDWGREEFDANWRSRLQQTAPMRDGKDGTLGPVARGARSSTERAPELAARHSDQSPRWGYAVSTAAIGESKERSFLYQVKRGDTLAKVAARYKLSIKEIAAFNGISSATRIRTGSKLRIVAPEGV